MHYLLYFGHLPWQKLPQIDIIYYFHKKMFAFLAYVHFLLYLCE